MPKLRVQGIDFGGCAPGLSPLTGDAGNTDPAAGCRRCMSRIFKLADRGRGRPKAFHLSQFRRWYAETGGDDAT